MTMAMEREGFPRQVRHFESPNKTDTIVRMIGRGRDRVDTLETAVQRRCTMSIGIQVQHASQRRTGARSGHQPIEQGLYIEATPCDNQGALATLPYSMQRVLCRAEKLGGATALMRQEKIKQMVWDLGLLRSRRLGCADIHVAIELAGVNIDDLSIERLCNRQGKSRFPHCSGSNEHEKRLLHGGDCLSAHY
jgi:hypothetical protein